MNPNGDGGVAASPNGDDEERSDDATPRSGAEPGPHMVARPFEGLFEGSNGRYYTDWQVRERHRTGEWRLCIRQRTPDRRLVETGDGSLLLLAPTDADALPVGVEIRVADGCARVVDTRRRVSE